jgi:hypothetical protein
MSEKSITSNLGKQSTLSMKTHLAIRSRYSVLVRILTYMRVNSRTGRPRSGLGGTRLLACRVTTCQLQAQVLLQLFRPGSA